MKIRQPQPGLYLVDLDQPLEGFRAFIGSWVLRRGSVAVVVDPGPSSTVPVLLKALADLEVRRIDAVLLTHVHIDHAGGVGLLLRHHPEAQVICHPLGVPHLVDPSRLWAGSQKVLGAIAEAYGEIVPSPPAAVTYREALELGPVRIEALETPGHAAHHLCFRVGGLVFVGEAAGVCLPGEWGLYVRPATPPVFVYDIYRSSLERVRELPISRLCFGHHGETREVERVLDIALKQLDLWVGTAGRHRCKGGTWEEAALEELLEADPALRAYGRFPEDVQARERYFALNSLRGIGAYLDGA